MTDPLPVPARRILDTLLNRYEQPNRLRVVRVRLAADTDGEYFSAHDVAPRTQTNDALKALAARGVLRLHWQKWEEDNWLAAVDLIAEQAHELMKEDLMLVVLGTGDRKYEKLFSALAAAYPGRVGLKIAYDNVLAHKVEAGADMFMMPSRYEPSGLNQMYSLKYGTVPIVRATGGLDDSIEPFDAEHGTGTGFKFYEYSGEALLYAVQQALHHYMDERDWKRIQLNGMAKDFSWKRPAGEYATLYEVARAAHGFAPTREVAKAEKVETAEKEAGAKGRPRRRAGKAARAVGQPTPGDGQAFQPAEPLGPEKESRPATQESTQSTESSMQDPQESGPDPGNPGEVGRNQKPAATSN